MNITKNQGEVRTRILHHSIRLFIQFGIRTIRMEDVAEHLGMSKKTLYQYFTSKEELVGYVMKSHFSGQLQQARHLQAKASNPIIGAWLLWNQLVLVGQTTNPGLLRDIKRYFPVVWTLLQEVRANSLKSILVNNFRLGIEQGLYRTDLDVSTLALLWTAESEWVLNHPETETSVKHHFIRGLLTPIGLAVYETCLTDMN